MHTLIRQAFRAESELLYPAEKVPDWISYQEKSNRATVGTGIPILIPL
jgi:hypothetical protein